MLLVCLAAAVLLTACGSPQPRPTVTTEVMREQILAPANDLSFNDVYQRVTQAITREGSVFHTTIRISRAEVTPPAPTPTPGGRWTTDEALDAYKVEIWVDTRAVLARTDESGLSETASGTKIYRQQIIRSNDSFSTMDGKATEWARRSGGESIRCRGSDSPLLAQLMLCMNGLEKSQTTVMTGQFGSRDAIVLATEGVAPDEDRNSPFTARVYVDKTTWLPIAEEYRLDYGSEITDETSTYDNDFVARSSLPADFFEPDAIGYVPDPEALLKKMDPGIPVYWLGLHGLGSDGRPDLELTLSTVKGTKSSSPPRLRLQYYSLAEPHGPDIIDLQEFATAEWDAFIAQPGGDIWDDPAETVGFKTEFDPTFVEKILTRAASRVPVLAEAGVNPRRAWAGLYEMTPDHHAIIGPAPNVKGLYFVNGFSGHGVMHSPASGHIAAELILQGQSRLIDAGQLSVERFAQGKLLEETAIL